MLLENVTHTSTVLKANWSSNRNEARLSCGTTMCLMMMVHGSGDWITGCTTVTVTSLKARNGWPLIGST